MKIYGFSGLGADESVYHLLNNNLKIPIIPLPWITPHENESIEDYAFRFSKKINTTDKIVLVGVSFGGIIATEIAKLINPEKLILISSIAVQAEIPWYFRMMGFSKINKIIPQKFILPPPFINNWIFSVRDIKYQEMLNKILENTDQRFAKWAIDQIVNWKNTEVPKNLIRIHGTKDRLLPLSNHHSIEIRNGGHFMIVQNAEEIADIINREIENLEAKIELRRK